MAVEESGDLERARERHRRLCDAFERLHALETRERADALARLQQESPDLVADVSAMLAASEGSALRPRAASPPAAATDTPGLERGYRVLRELGRGGMGRVLLAERADGRFARQVAIKILDRSSDDADWRRRFEAERDILGRLIHPNIARLLDAGESADGTPYLVMEYVDGIALDTWLGQRSPSLEERLNVFRCIAQAIAYAHQCLVAHRDLKPANILVDSSGTPHLLDFGIARLLDQHCTTVTEARALTPRYAAPEQVAGAPATAAVDVYQLGVLLCELLAGETPFTSLSGTALLAAIGRDERERPSKIAQRQQPPLPWNRRLRGDLDAVVDKAMRQDPLQRYRSVDALLEDLTRWRRGLPVLARRGGRLYRLRKFARRHWLALAAALVVVVLSGAFVWRLQSELARSEREEATARQVTELMIDVLGNVDPRRAKGHELTLREALDQGVQRIRAQGDLPDAVRGRLLHALGIVYLEISHFDTAAEMLEEALPYRERAGTTLDAVNTAYALAVLRQRQGQLDEADHWVRHSLQLLLKGRPDDHQFLAELHNGLAIVSRMRGYEDIAAEEFESAVSLLQGHGDTYSEDLAPLLRNYAEFLDDRREHARAFRLLEESERYAALSYPGDDPERARLLRAQGRNALFTESATAAALLDQSWQMTQRLFPSPHDERVRVADLLSQERWVHGDAAAAEALLDEAMTQGERLFPQGHSRLFAVATRLGALRLLRGDVAAAQAAVAVALRSRSAEGNSTGDIKALALLQAALTCRVTATATGVANDEVFTDAQFPPWLKTSWRAVRALCP